MPDAQVKRPRTLAGVGAGGAGKQTDEQRRNSTDDAEQLELFDKPPIAPMLPGRRTMAYQVLLLLLAGEAVTQPLWLDLQGSWRLAASVDVLKNHLGWPVVQTLIPAASPESPNRKIASYRMVRVGIEAGRELLRQARRTAAAKEGAAE